MNEPWIDELISAYLDGELSPTEQARVEQALVADARLRQMYDDLRALRQLLVALPKAKLDDQFAARVMARAKEALAAQNGEARTIPFVQKPAAVVTPAAASQTMHHSSWRVMTISVVGLAAALLLAFMLPGQFGDLAKRAIGPSEENVALAPVKSPAAPEFARNVPRDNQVQDLANAAPMPMIRTANPSADTISPSGTAESPQQPRVALDKVNDGALKEGVISREGDLAKDTSDRISTGAALKKIEELDAIHTEGIVVVRLQTTAPANLSLALANSDISFDEKAKSQLAAKTDASRAEESKSQAGAKVAVEGTERAVLSTPVDRYTRELGDEIPADVQRQLQAGEVELVYVVASPEQIAKTLSQLELLQELSQQTESRAFQQGAAVRGVSPPTVNQRDQNAQGANRVRMKADAEGARRLASGGGFGGRQAPRGFGGGGFGGGGGGRGGRGGGGGGLGGGGFRGAAPNAFDEKQGNERAPVEPGVGASPATGAIAEATAKRISADMLLPRATAQDKPGADADVKKLADGDDVREKVDRAPEQSRAFSRGASKPDEKTAELFSLREGEVDSGRRMRVLFVIPKPREAAKEAKPAAPPQP